MDNQELEQYLGTIVDDLYQGLRSVAAKVRGDASREEIAEEIEELAGEICQHWPNCFNGNPSPEQVAKKKLS